MSSIVGYVITCDSSFANFLGRKDDGEVVINDRVGSGFIFALSFISAVLSFVVRCWIFQK